MARRKPENDRVFEMFHGKEPTGVEEIPFDCPEYLIELGRCDAVEYSCSKINGAPRDRAGKMTAYRHSMAGKGDRIFTNPERNMLIILGPRLRVEDRGIVN